MTSSADTKATVIEESEKVEINPLTSAERRLSWFGRILSRETALHQSVFSLADQGVASTTNFLTGVIIARACSKEELGLYMLGFSIILLMGDLQTSLIATPYMVHAPGLKATARALYTGSTLIHQLALSLLVVVALAGGGLAVRSGVGPRGLGPVLLALVVVVAFIMLREYVRRVCFAQLHMKTALLVDSSVGVVQLGGLLLLAYFHLLSASRAYWIVGVACGMAALGWLAVNDKGVALSMRHAISDLRRNWSLGKWVLLSGLVWTISMNLYPWLLAAFHGTASAGVWAACLGAVAIGNPVVLGVQNFLGPKIAHVYAEKGARPLQKFVLKASAASSLPMLIFALSMIFLGGPLVTMLYGRQYAGNGMAVTILAFNLAVSVVMFPFSRALFAIDRAGVDFVVNFIALFIMLTFGLWLVRSYGVSGAAVGLLTANSAASGVRYVAFRVLVRLEARRGITGAAVNEGIA